MKKVFFCLIFLVSCSSNSDSLTRLKNPVGNKNVAYYWGKIALEATANDTERFQPRPTITSRYLGLIFTSVFDAWTSYDKNAIPVYSKDIGKVDEKLNTLKNKEISISYAAYTALKEYYYSDSLLFKEKMEDLGLNPNLKNPVKNTPEYIGIKAALDVINKRKNDGSNQYGELSPDGSKYFDYTYYSPVNPPGVMNDINKWQPKYYYNEDKGKFAPPVLTPYWQNVSPITLENSSQFRPPPPPYWGSEQLNNEIEEVVELQSNLSIEQKGLVEFMRDGPKSVQQAGHWLIFAQDVSVRDNHNIDDDVKMYFLNQITAMDAFIANWDSKMFYDYARPMPLAQKFYMGKTIRGWLGYNEGWGEIKGEKWRPYSPDNFLCPQFPSYVSGHSTVSAACAEALRLYTGSDEFGITVNVVAGSLTENEEFWENVTLEFPTFTQAGEMAGISRVLGGYHIQSDNIEGLKLGRKVANNAYQFYLNHLGEEN